MMDDLQIPYKIMLERMINMNRGDTVNIFLARRVFTYYYRMPKTLVNGMFRELKKCGAICAVDKNSIRIIWKPETEKNGIW